MILVMCEGGSVAGYVYGMAWLLVLMPMVTVVLVVSVR